MTMLTNELAGALKDEEKRKEYLAKLNGIIKVFDAKLEELDYIKDRTDQIILQEKPRNGIEGEEGMIAKISLPPIIFNWRPSCTSI
jgi:hypothetical protein